MDREPRPLAGRLGIQWLKAELEDLAFRFLEPEHYQRVARQVAERRSDRERFIKDMDSKRIDKAIEKELQLAVKMDLFNTPTFFINGRKVVGNRPYAYLKKIVDEELAGGK